MISEKQVVWRDAASINPPLSPFSKGGNERDLKEGGLEGRSPSILILPLSL